MLMSRFPEAVVEDAALAWLESLGYSVRHGLEIAPGELAAEKSGTVGPIGQGG
jgi:type I restriction enzyme R subunit